MSVELLRNLREEDAIDLDELGVLLGGLSRSGAHRYMEGTELRFGQLLVLFRHAKSDRVREAILAELIPGSGYLVIQLPDALDCDGDGQVNDRDVLHKTNEGIAHSSLAIAELANQDRPEDVDAWATALQDHLAKVIAAATAASAAVEFVRKHQPRRRSARPQLIGLGQQGVRRG